MMVFMQGNHAEDIRKLLRHVNNFCLSDVLSEKPLCVNSKCTFSEPWADMFEQWAVAGQRVTPSPWRVWFTTLTHLIPRPLKQSGNEVRVCVCVCFGAALGKKRQQELAVKLQPTGGSSTPAKLNGSQWAWEGNHCRLQCFSKWGLPEGASERHWNQQKGLAKNANKCP